MSVYEPKTYDPNNPLVSVLVYNYNYGRYLRDCLESIMSQTYQNFEITFSDNASDDESWDIALELAKKYPGKMSITRNRKNFGSDANFNNCIENMRGRYFINMCSDDMLAPDYIETCVRTMQNNPGLGFVMVHRAILDQDNNHVEEAPFYNQSCEIDGPEQAAVYMMAAVNPSVSQIMYDTKKALGEGQKVTGTFVSRWYGTRITDFRLCMQYPIAYIKEPLLLHRIHGENDSLAAADNLMEVIGPYVLQHQFADTATNFGEQKVVERLPASIAKLAMLSLRYCIRALVCRNEILAKRYFHLALAMNVEVENDDVFKELDRYWKASKDDKVCILNKLNSTDGLVYRDISYDPPENSRPILV